jgi:CRISPR-associated protein Cas1
MGYINIFVSKEASISVKNNQLFLRNCNNNADYPLEDINSIMIENLTTSVTTYSLSKFAEYGILVFVCNQNHLPCGVVLPFCEHYQTLSQFEYQVNLAKPLQKQLWQSIIKNKIANQNEVLNNFGGKDDLKKLQQEVLSGDVLNTEATASLIYFKKIFGDDFKRRDENPINSFLNYGYSIVRGFVARSVACHGLIPFYGINHCNKFNQFNLADDLIEVFRPLVDLFVKTNLSTEKEMTSSIKKQIYNLINYDVEIDKQKQTLSNAIDMYVEYFVKSIKENKNKLKTVNIIGLNFHNYE